MNHRLMINPFLQYWDGSTLSLRVLLAPYGNPLDALVPGEPAFVDWAPSLTVREVAGLDAMPTLGSPAEETVHNLPLAPRARALCVALQQELQIESVSSPVDPRIAGMKFLKYAPRPYREATGFSGGHPFLVADDRYRCALQSEVPAGTSVKAEDPALPWGKVLAMALRQPLLREELGLVRTIDIDASPQLVEEGGWVYITLSAGATLSGLLAVPDAVKSYAARVPRLDSARHLFTPVLFPVAAAVPAANYDEVFRDAVDYDDGFAKVVYAGQPSQIDPFDEDDSDDRPALDVGARVGWDDEQVTTWMNRQVRPDYAVQDALLGVLGYRVDARVAGDEEWTSLVRGRTRLAVDTIDLGAYDGDFGVEIAPSKLLGDESGTYWFPMYFTTWSGPSLVGPDEVAYRLHEIDPGGPVAGLDPGLPLRYGETYEFRVRFIDQTGGGPALTDEPRNPSTQPRGVLPFRRYVRPGPLGVEQTEQDMSLYRPRLAYPSCMYAGSSVTALLADIPNAKVAQRAVGLPDPDVDRVSIDVRVAMPGADDGYQTLYSTTRGFPVHVEDALKLEFDWQDVADASGLSVNEMGALPLPTSRRVRIVVRALAAERDGYYAADDVRHGPTSQIDLLKSADDERALFLPQQPSDAVRAHFLRPDVEVDAVVAAAQAASGNGNTAPADALGRLAAASELRRIDYGLRGRTGQRVLFGCSSTLRHIIGPDGASIRFSSAGDLTRLWLVMVRGTLNRDWSHDGLSYVAVLRDGEEAGRIELPRSIGEEAHGSSPARSDLLFIDAIDPRPAPGEEPQEIQTSYALVPAFRAAPTLSDPFASTDITLPIAVAPTQVPRLISAGIAMSPYVRDADYASTQLRDRVLWFEFDAPPTFDSDLYFGRVLATAADPVLAHTVSLPQEQAEPPLVIDPEPIRTIVPAQADDSAGLSAMQPLLKTDSPRHYLVPLPSGLNPESEELFGFFTYELRVGHASGWTTAQGRFGRPLRVNGVQHPAPPLRCAVYRRPTGIDVSASFARTLHNGKPLVPSSPVTELWVLLYTQVVQSDGKERRNLLISRRQARQNYSKWETVGMARHVSSASARWSDDEIEPLLDSLGLDRHSPLSCIAAETLPADNPVPDPLGTGLGYERFLRTSPLTKIPDTC